MPNYTAVIRAHITVTINADDPHEFMQKLQRWKDANRAKRYGRTVPATVVIVPGMPVVALDQQRMPIQQQQLSLPLKAK